MMSCKAVSELVSASLDRELPFGQRMKVRLHMMMCTGCSRFRKQVLFLRAAASRMWRDEVQPEEASAGLSPEARERMKQAIRAG